MRVVKIILIAVVGGAGLAFAFSFFLSMLDQINTNRGFALDMPEAPDGWTVAPYEVAQAEMITGVSYDPAAEPTTDTETLIARFNAGVEDDDNLVQAYLNEDQIILLRMRYSPKAQPRAGISAQLAEVREAREAEGPQPTLFARMDGISFMQDLPFSKNSDTGEVVPINYRYLTATVGVPEETKYVPIEVLTNASDAALAAMISGIDMAALNDKIDVPDEQIDGAAGFVTDAETPLSDEPPVPTPAYQAYQLLQSDQDLDETTQAILTKIVGPDVTRADVADDLAELEEIAPEIRAIVELLPVESDG